ncbi:MAG: DUF3341 domain-containing protein [Sumerlaeia bacterium]
MSERRASSLYALAAEFASPGALIEGTRAMAGLGLRRMEAYTPTEIEGLDDVLPEASDHRVGWIAFGGGVAGAVIGFGFQMWVNMMAYPMNVGGRPFFSWPAFLPVTFEMAVLCASLSAFLAFFVLCRLPRLNHPFFESALAERASQDRYILLVEADDPRFKATEVGDGLREAGALSVEEVRV